MLFNGGNIKWREILRDLVSKETLVLEKCIKQRVPNVGMNVKYHSSQLKESQFFVENATKKRKDSKR